MIDGRTGNHIWAKRYDRELNDIFAVQDDLTGSIVASVEPELGKAERDRARSRTSNLTAWDLYQRGVWHLYRRRHADLLEAKRLFDSALTLEPELVPALCAASEAYYFRIVFGYTDDSDVDRREMMRLARQAVELDNEDGAAHCALARASLAAAQRDDAVSHAVAATSLNPSSGYAQYILGLTYAYAGQAQQAIPCLEAALTLSPHDAYTGRYMAALAEANLFDGGLAIAIDWASKAVRQPTLVHWSGRASLAAALGLSGRLSEAQRAAADLLAQWPSFSIHFLRRASTILHPEYIARYSDGLRKAGLPE